MTESGVGPQPGRQSRFGSLVVDMDAIDKRRAVKFFDSAEWAMQGTKLDSPPQSVRPLATIDEIQKQSELRACFERSPLVA